MLGALTFPHIGVKIKSVHHISLLGNEEKHPLVDIDSFRPGKEFGGSFHTFLLVGCPVVCARGVVGRC